jgi:hypothetical protein
MWHSDLLKEIKEYLKKFNITITSLNDFSIEKKQDTAKVQYDESKGIVTLNIGKFSPIEKVTDFMRNVPPNFIKVYQSISCKCAT